MNYNYTREHQLPIVMELTYEDLQLIQKMAKLVIDMETTPDGIYKGDARKMAREVTEALNKVANAVKYAFPSTEE
jgi:t-SNARE complex subunit (syntaxin)